MESENGVEDLPPSEEARALDEETAPAVTLERNVAPHERRHELDSSNVVTIADYPVSVTAADEGDEGLKAESPGIENSHYTPENLEEAVTLVCQEGNLTYDRQQSSHRIEVPNNKMESDQDKNKQAIWNDELVQVFCGLCIKNIEARKQPSKHSGVKGWTTMVDEFVELTGKFYTKVQLKNKWDALKGDWKTWKQLKGKDTGLKWDPINKRIEASNDWWLKRLEAIPKAKRFRKKGIPPEFEAKLDRMFMNTVTGGDSFWAPSSGSLLQESRESPKNVIPTVSSDDSSEDIEAYTTNDNVVEKSTNAMGKEYKKSSSCMSKGRKRKRICDAEKLSNQIDRLCKVVENKSTPSSKKGDIFIPSISSVMEQLDVLPHIHLDFELYLFATRLFMSSEKREMFVAIKKPEFKIAWLKNEQAKQPNL